MAKASRDRVAVYINFDNISLYNQLHGDGAFAKDRVRTFVANPSQLRPGSCSAPREATVDVAAVLDYALSFGTIVVSRALRRLVGAVLRQLTRRSSPGAPWI